MAWWNRSSTVPESLSTGQVIVPQSALTAAVTAVTAGRQRLVPRTDTWQEDVWRYYDSLGEFRFAVDWRSEVMSRIRLRAARIRLGRDEPDIVDTGPAAEVVSRFAGGPGGQTDVITTLTTLLDVPGEGWIVGEGLDSVEPEWFIRSSDEIRSRGSRPRRGANQGGGSVVEIVDDDESARLGSVRWRPLRDEYAVVRAWRPHKRYRYLADSRARTARSTMGELELVNRALQAQYLSRLASAGLVVFPAEIEFPVRPEFQDEPNPFVREWIETAREAIATPGTAAATVPIPIKVPGEYVDKIRFLDFTMTLDEQLIEKRESAIKRLATQLDMPAEVMLGMGGVNHWSAWQLEESGIKIHIMPTAELIYHSLTAGYLHPQLEAIGEDPTDWVVWGDTSEITLRPDRSAAASEAYDKVELSAAAYRRELGFDEDDAPTDDELERQLLLQLARDPQTGPAALEKLTGVDVAPEPSAPSAPPLPGTEGNETGPPDTRDEAPPPPDEGAALRARLVDVILRNGAFSASRRDSTVTAHVVDISMGRWTLLHPFDCDMDIHSCPYTLGAVAHSGVAPGSTGRYACELDGSRLILGRRLIHANGADGASRGT